MVGTEPSAQTQHLSTDLLCDLHLVDLSLLQHSQLLQEYRQGGRHLDRGVSCRGGTGWRGLLQGAGTPLMRSRPSQRRGGGGRGGGAEGGRQGGGGGGGRDAQLWGGHGGVGVGVGLVGGLARQRVVVVVAVTVAVAGLGVGRGRGVCLGGQGRVREVGREGGEGVGQGGGVGGDVVVGPVGGGGALAGQGRGVQPPGRRPRGQRRVVVLDGRRRGGGGGGGGRGVGR